MKKILLVVLITIINYNLFGQTHSTCTLVYDEITITQTCRYCKVNKSYKESGNVHFKDNKDQIRYKSIINKLSGNLTLNTGVTDLLLGNGNKVSKICDISMTSKHGFEKTSSRTQKQKNIQRSKCEEYLSKSNQKSKPINSQPTNSKESIKKTKTIENNSETYFDRKSKFNFGG